MEKKWYLFRHKTRSRHPTPKPEIGIMNSDGTNERILTTLDRVNVDSTGSFCETANDANAPNWSPTDNRIAFWSADWAIVKKR